MPGSVVASGRGAAGSPESEETLSADFAEMASRQLAENCPYAFYYRDVSIHFSKGVLTVTGRLPSFYLKHVLHSYLMRLDGVERLNDQVDIVSSWGLSSVRDK
jgi:hypothetical protein